MAKVLLLLPANLVYQKRNHKLFDHYRERIYFTAAVWLIYQNIRVKNRLQIIVKVLFHYQNPYVEMLKIPILKRRLNVSNSKNYKYNYS